MLLLRALLACGKSMTAVIQRVPQPSNDAYDDRHTRVRRPPYHKLWSVNTEAFRPEQFVISAFSFEFSAFYANFAYIFIFIER